MALSPLAISLLMQPPPAPARPGQVAPTDVQGAFNASTAEANTQYQAKLAQQNAMWGGLAGLGGAGIIASPKLFGTGGPLSGLLGGSASASPATWSFPAADAASSAALPYAGGAADASSLGSWLSDPALASIGTASPVAAADAGASALGPVAAADAAGTAAAGAGAAGAADVGSLGLADLLPFLFA